MSTRSSENQILDAALLLVQTRGYQGFSYADIAESVEIRKASIHYYFPGKSDLGIRLVRDYRASMRAHRERIDAVSPGTEDKLRAFAQLFRAMLRDPQAEGGRICLCTALSAELFGLPIAVRREVAAYFEETETWLSIVLGNGRELGEARFPGPARVQASGLISAFTGAMLLARAQSDPASYCSVAHLMLAHLGLNVSEQEIADPDAALSLRFEPQSQLASIGG